MEQSEASAIGRIVALVAILAVLSRRSLGGLKR